MSNKGLETGTISAVLSCEPPDGLESLWVSAREELAVLQADTSRWDFMEKYKPILYPPAATLQGNWVIVLPNSGPQFEGSDPRAAIDAAIEKMKEGT